MKKKESTSIEHDPLIGIWWDDGGTIADFSHPYSVNSSNVAGRVDSNFAHVDLWRDAALRMKIDHRNEYFSVPRGRVLFDRRTRTGIVLHGNATNAERQKKIAELFRLTKWRAETDLHYSMGAEADRLFEDDD